MEIDGGGAVRLIPWGGSVEMRLEFMRRSGSSVLLNWGEDNDAWECSWISDGIRYSGFSATMGDAVHQALRAGIESRP